MRTKNINELRNYDVYSVKDMIADRIKQVRIRKNVSQPELAKLTGMSRTNIANLETGNHNLSIKNLYKICVALDVEVIDILPSISVVGDYY